MIELISFFSLFLLPIPFLILFVVGPPSVAAAAVGEEDRATTTTTYGRSSLVVVFSVSVAPRSEHHSAVFGRLPVAHGRAGGRTTVPSRVRRNELKILDVFSDSCPTLGQIHFDKWLTMVDNRLSNVLQRSLFVGLEELAGISGRREAVRCLLSGHITVSRVLSERGVACGRRGK